MRSAATLAYQRTRTYRRARWRAFLIGARNVAALIGFGSFLGLLFHLSQGSIH